MEIHVPSIEDVRKALGPLNLKQLEALAVLSGVPFTTIYKIKRAETANPGIETIRQFMPHIAAAFLEPSSVAGDGDRAPAAEHQG